MTAIDLRKIRPIDLAIFFNAMLLSGSIPPALKACRNISSWRPITVANILVQTLHSLLSSRLTDRLRLHPAQSPGSFISLDGTMGNSILLQTTIRTCLFEARPYSIVSLDFRKAFDTVPHTLGRLYYGRPHGLPTTIKVGSNLIENIPIRRGVKQGDPYHLCCSPWFWMNRFVSSTPNRLESK